MVSLWIRQNVIKIGIFETNQKWALHSHSYSPMPFIQISEQWTWLSFKPKRHSSGSASTSSSINSRQPHLAEESSSKNINYSRTDASFHHWYGGSINWKTDKKYAIVMSCPPTPKIRVDKLGPIPIWMCFVACLPNVKLKIGPQCYGLYVFHFNMHSIINIHLHNILCISTILIKS